MSDPSMFPIVFEPTLSAGLILQTFVLVATGTWFLSGFRNRINVMQIDIHHLQEVQRTVSESISQLGKILTSLALQDQRVAMLEKRVDEMAHGQGFIKKDRTIGHHH